MALLKTVTSSRQGCLNASVTRNHLLRAVVNTAVVRTNQVQDRLRIKSLLLTILQNRTPAYEVVAQEIELFLAQLDLTDERVEVVEIGVRVANVYHMWMNPNEGLGDLDLEALLPEDREEVMKRFQPTSVLPENLPPPQYDSVAEELVYVVLSRYFGHVGNISFIEKDTTDEEPDEYSE